MIRPLNWGVVATGRIAHRVTRDLALLENTVLHAVSSRSPAAAKEFAGQYGFAARERKLFLMEAVWTRFLPATLRALEVVRGKEIGAVPVGSGRSGFCGHL